MSSKKATPPPQKGPNLFSLFAKVAEKKTQGGNTDAAPTHHPVKQKVVVDLTTETARAPLKNVDNVAGAVDNADNATVAAAATATAAAAAPHTKSGRVVVQDASNSRRISGGGGGLGDLQSPQASVGDAFMTPAHPLRAQHQDQQQQRHPVDGSPMMCDGGDTPATTVSSDAQGEDEAISPHTRSIKAPPPPTHTILNFHPLVTAYNLCTNNKPQKEKREVVLQTRILAKRNTPPSGLSRVRMDDER